MGYGRLEVGILYVDIRGKISGILEIGGKKSWDMGVKKLGIWDIGFPVSPPS